MNDNAIERLTDKFDGLQKLVGDQNKEMAELKEMIFSIQGLLAAPQVARDWYTVEEAAKLLGKAPYTVRQWCLEGRINAEKRPERRGGAELWSISAAEVERYRNEGLLPRERVRRAG